jgi:hypothetical protein
MLDRLLIREKLHGRAHGLEALLGAFERVVSAAGPYLIGLMTS